MTCHVRPRPLNFKRIISQEWVLFVTCVSTHGRLLGTNPRGGVTKAAKVGPCATRLWKHEPRTPGPSLKTQVLVCVIVSGVRQNAEEGWDRGSAAPLAECGRVMYDSQGCEEPSSHFTITGEIIIAWPQTRRRPHRQELAFSKQVRGGTSSQHFSNVTYLIFDSFQGSASAGNAEFWRHILPTLWSINLWTAFGFHAAWSCPSYPDLEIGRVLAIRWPNICFWARKEFGLPEETIWNQRAITHSSSLSAMLLCSE